MSCFRRTYVLSAFIAIFCIGACASPTQKPIATQTQAGTPPTTSAATPQLPDTTHNNGTTSDKSMQLAFVLASGDALPSPESVIEAARKLGETELTITKSDSNNSLSFSHKMGFFLVSLMPTQHPDAATMTVGLDSPSPEEIAATSAHFVLVLGAGPGEKREREVVLARLTAAVALANKAPGAMLGHGITFHRTTSFIEAVYRAGDHLPVPGAVDFTIAMEGNERVSLLTHGMTRYGREDLFVTAKRTNDDLNDAYEFARAIATWMLTDNREFPDGDTVGRNEAEKVKIRRVTSPIAPDVKIIRLDL